MRVVFVVFSERREIKSKRHPPSALTQGRSPYKEFRWSLGNRVGLNGGKFAPEAIDVSYVATTVRQTRSQQMNSIAGAMLLCLLGFNPILSVKARLGES